MAKNLDDAIKAMQDIVGDVTGIRAAPEYATDKFPPGIFSMAFPVTGSFEQAPQGNLQGLHDIGMYIVSARTSMAKNLAALIPLGELVAAALENNPTLLSTVETFGPVNYEFRFSINVGTPAAPMYLIGWDITVTGVKIHATL